MRHPGGLRRSTGLAAAVALTPLVAACVTSGTANDPAPESPKTSGAAPPARLEDVDLSGFRTTKIVVIGDGDRLALFDGAAEHEDGGRGPTVLAENDDGTTSRWELGDRAPLIHPQVWSEENRLYVMGVQCPDIEVGRIDEIETFSEVCGPVDGGVVLSVDLADGQSEVVVGEVPVDGDGVAIYTPGTSFDVAAVSTGAEAEDLFAVDRANGAVTELGRVGGDRSTICSSGSGFLRVVEPADRFPTKFEGPIGVEDSEDETPEETEPEEPEPEVQRILRTGVEDLVVPEPPALGVVVRPAGCGPDGALVIVSDDDEEPRVELVVDDEERLMWTALPAAPEDFEVPITAITTEDRSVVAMAPVPSLPGLTLLVLIDGAWERTGVDITRNNSHTEITVAGRRVAWLEPGSTGPRMKVQEF